jgi:hypothetical protein
MADKQRSPLPEPLSRTHGKEASREKPQLKSHSSSGSMTYSTPHKDESKPTLEETCTEEHEQVSPQMAQASSSVTGEEWERFARLIKLPDCTTRWQCHWRTMDDGAEVDCGYLSKKQLVKRHIETTHLKYK